MVYLWSIMIQRIQTIYLLLTAISFAVLFALPFAVSSKPAISFFSDSTFNVLDHVALAGLAIAGGFLTLITIFLYKNRNLQIKLGYLIIVMWIALAGLAAYWLYITMKQLPSEVSVVNQAGLFIPAGGILFILLALFSIRKDNKIVKSMHRLR